MSDNPLKAYFRRPVIYFKLPSGGKYYPPGVVNIPPNGELPVYAMTSADEIDVKTPDGLFNGASTVRVIKNCIPNIIDPWQLNDVDIEATIIAIRAATVDGKMEVVTTCPECSEESKYDIDLLKLLNEKQDIDYEAPLTIGELEIKFRPLTYHQTNQNGIKQFEIQRFAALMETHEDEIEKQKVLSEALKQLNEMMIGVVTQTIEYIKTPETTVTSSEYISEFLTGCDGKTNKIIKEYSSEMRQKNDTKPLQMTCMHCRHEYKQPLVLNFTDFFV
jgi:hypothetical protein